MLSEIEIRIKQTEIPGAGLIVVTARLTNPAVAKPFETFSICNSSGYVSPIAYYTTEAETLATHDDLAAYLRRREGGMTDDRKMEIKKQIEIADSVLWQTREYRSGDWFRDYTWLQNERARLVRKLHELENAQ